MKKSLLFSLAIIGIILTGCEKQQAIVNQVDEREANEIIVFLASRGINATKVQAEATTTGAGPSNMWNISTPPDRMTEAMALLNENGLPRRVGTTLLELFSAEGMMTSDREELIRYQAGIAEELKNMIRMIDGVLDVNVQLAFPPEETTAMPGQKTQNVTASVFVKHQGAFDDPNNYLEMKIRRLVSGAVTALSYDDVTVVADRSRLTDLSLSARGEIISAMPRQENQAEIWSIKMDKSSTARFRFIFFSLILLLLLFGGFIVLMIYRFYPQMIKNNPESEKKEQKPKE